MMIRRKVQEAGDIKAFLGKGSEFEGKLTFHETVRIDGNFTGQIISGDTLIIGDAAVVKAEISVGKAIISGTVEGNIKVRERLELHSSARVTGNISAPKLVVMDGAIFEGSSQMGVTGEVEKEGAKRPTLLNRLEAAG